VCWLGRTCLVTRVVEMPEPRIVHGASRLTSGAHVCSVAVWMVLCVEGAEAQHGIVTADGPPAWGSTPTLVEEVRIGSIAGDATFGNCTTDYRRGTCGGRIEA